jgi:uncharacterized Zn finger protein
MSGETLLKAERLHDGGNVRRVDDADVFTVESGPRLYLVVIAAGKAFCSCPASGECSHVLAALRFEAAERS